MSDETHAVANATETDPKRDWSYVSEGGASIVFCYVGPNHPTFNGTVLRLRKVTRSSTASAQHLPPTLQDSDQEEPDDPSIAFQDTVTTKLVPSAHLPRLQTVDVSPVWLKALAEVVEAQRPIERSAKDGIDISRRKAVLATDLVGGEGWAVEIKPKWGFLPAPKYLSHSTSPIKLRHCRFCMHVHLKGKKEDAAAAGYCPLDLYSGNRGRVQRALERLWEAWVNSRGKVNNLRVFVEGKIVDPGDASSFSRIAAQLPGSGSGVQRLSDLQLPFIEALLPLLMNTRLLSTLSHLQRTFDSHDIEGLSQFWSSTHPEVSIGQGEPDPSLGEWREFVRTYLSEPPTDEEADLRYSILAYLLSATFKDCSIILRLGRLGEDGAGRLGDTITAIDLDPKSVSRLAKWEALDQEIVRSFADTAPEQQACIDAQGVRS